ncbi:hypothetical protein D3C81_1488960 [compost metagenome]
MFRLSWFIFRQFYRRSILVTPRIQRVGTRSDRTQCRLAPYQFSTIGSARRQRMAFAHIYRRYPRAHHDMAGYNADQRTADQVALGGRHNQSALAFCAQRVVGGCRVDPLRWILERPCFAGFFR